VPEGTPFTLKFTGATDPSPADVAAGFTYAFDCGSGIFGAFSGSSTSPCPTVDNGPRTVRGQVRDKDGALSTYSATQRVTNVAPKVTIAAASPRPITRGGSFSIGITFTDPGTTDNPWTVTLVWGNGNQTVITPTQWAGVVRTRVYPKAGTYTVRVTVKDKNGTVGSSNSLTLKVQ
jgi:hypothetical protein